MLVDSLAGVLVSCSQLCRELFVVLYKPHPCCAAAGDSLGCIADTAVRQQRVRESAAWAWHGYR